MRVGTFGTFDVFHVGHLNILESAKALGAELVVGVSSDQLNMEKKGRVPVFDESHRMRLVGALSCVDRVFLEESLDLKREYIRDYGIELLIMGDDWEGKFDHLRDCCSVQYLPRTPAISTSAIIEVVKVR